MTTALRRHIPLLAILALGMALEAVLLVAGTVPFNSDEAVVGLILMFYLVAIVYSARPTRTGHRTSGRVLLLLMVLVFTLVVVGSRFGIDMTGRYLLPLITPVIIFAAMVLEVVYYSRPHLATAMLFAVVVFNYWVSFRLAFESGEKIILAPLLPYRENLHVSASDNRYPPYEETVARSDTVVYVTANQPQLDALLRARLSDPGVGSQEKVLGPY